MQTHVYVIGHIEYNLYVGTANVLILYSLTNGYPLVVFEIKNVGEYHKLLKKNIIDPDYRGISVDDYEVIATTYIDSEVKITYGNLEKTLTSGGEQAHFTSGLGSCVKIVVSGTDVLFKKTAWRSDRSYYTWKFKAACVPLSESKSLQNSPARGIDHSTLPCSPRRLAGLGISPSRALIDLRNESRDFIKKEQKHPILTISQLKPIDSPRVEKISDSYATCSVIMEYGTITPVEITGDLMEFLYEEIRQIHPVLVRSQYLTTEDLTVHSTAQSTTPTQ